MIISGRLPKIKTLFRKLSLSVLVREYLLVLMIAFLCHRGRMSAQCAGSEVASKRRHRGNVLRFLSKQGSRLSYARRRFVGRMLESHPHLRKKNLYVLIVDTTHVTQQGKMTENTISTGNRKRRPCEGRRYNENKRAPQSSHAHVFGLLLTPRGVRILYYLPFYTKAYCLQHGLMHRTQADLAAELIRQVHLPGGAKLLVLGDTAFEARQVRAACDEQNATWIVPANPERVLEGEKPRPKLWSLAANLTANQFVPIRLKLDDPTLAPYRRASACRLGSRTRTATFYTHRERRRVLNIGEVQIVFSTKQQPPSDKPVSRKQAKVLLTNDLSLSVREVVSWYTLRWQIELLFKELKSTLGLDQYRFRAFHRVVAWVEACIITFLFLEWTRMQKLKQRALSKRERTWWSRQRTHGITIAVRQHMEWSELQQIKKLTETDYGTRKLRRLVNNALPPEYSVAL